MSVDLYSPWRQPEVAARLHVGRQRELDAICSSARAFVGGAASLPMYVFGPRGVGKSHLLTMVRERLDGELRDAQLVWVPEDIPEQRSAEALLARMAIGARPRRWTRWRGDRARNTSSQPPAGRRIVLLEGLDRQLHALGSSGRHALRRLLDDRDDLWLVGTGVSLSTALTGREEAFYGAFDLRPLQPLGDDEAVVLLDAAAGEAEGELGRSWYARRRTMVALAGGNPRALVALAQAERRHPDGWASQQLHDVLRDFTAHYQMRFRDLSPQHQQMVALLAESPRELTPSDFARELQSSASQMSVQAGRLVDDGVLQHRTAGDKGRDRRQTWYSLAEPLFRFWLEYRNASWDETRAGWLGRLLQAMMSPQELAQAWWDHPDEEIRAAAGRMLTAAQCSQAWRKLYDEVVRATVDELPLLIDRARQLEPSPMLYMLVSRLLEANRGELLAGLDDPLALLCFDEQVRHQRQTPRDAFIQLVETLAEPPLADAWSLLFALRGCVAVLSRHRRGGPWRLRDAERRQLAQVPVFRAYFAEHGRLASHGPMLDTSDILAELDRAAPDAGELILTGVVRDDARLVQRAAEMFGPDSPWLFAPCPVPATPQPRAAADSILAAARRCGPSTPALITWAASFASASEDAFSAILETLPSAPDAWGEHSELALVALALRDRSRFDRVEGAITDAWRETFERASLLADQLGEAERGQLHPELETLRNALASS